MFHFLLMAVSYAALLLLLMPASIPGIAAAAVLIAAGVVVMLVKKIYRIPFYSRIDTALVPITGITAASFGLVIYDRWIHSTKLQTAASLLHMQLKPLLIVVSALLAVLSVYCLHVVLQTVYQKISRPSAFAAGSVLVASLATVGLGQDMIDTELLCMGVFRFLWAVLIVAVLILFLFCLFGRLVPAIAVVVGLFLLISSANVYVCLFRDRLFEPIDVLSAGTAMNVVGSYDLFPIPLSILYAWGFFAAMILLFHRLQKKIRWAPSAKSRWMTLGGCAVSSVAIFFYLRQIPIRHWSTEGAEYTGYILDFVSRFREISVSKPSHYSVDAVNELAEAYGAEDDGSETAPSKRPHIIVIMDEAFADLSVLGPFKTDKDVTPFISSLKEDTVSGYALVSAIGGGTANSEFEFLTGHSMAGFSAGVIPYQQYLRSPAYSMVSYLKLNYQYRCLAMHPYLPNGWNRPTAYANLGFDAFYSMDDFPQKNLIRKNVSDQEMFEFLIDAYEREKEEPLFIFGVTMQNHGGYTYSGENYTQEITLTEPVGEYGDVEQYLTLIHETDKAVEYLISYFQNVEEDVIIVFYGDHHPGFSGTFYADIGGDTAGDMDEQQKHYLVPFFIWANYDIEEASLERTSLNYLSTYVYEAAGYPLPLYDRFLREMEAVIPAINANGFYSLAAGRYLPFEEANEEERRWLETYEALRYNCLFDAKHRNEALFPVLEQPSAGSRK